MAFGSPQWMYASGDSPAASLKFVGPGSGGNKLSATLGTATSNRIFTISMWVKRGKLGSHQKIITRYNSEADRQYISFDTNDNIVMYQKDGASTAMAQYSTATFRDPNGWYHIVAAYDTTQGTDTNRAKLYVNNLQLTEFTGTGSPTYPALNLDLKMMTLTSDAIDIGHYNADAQYFDGLMAEVHFIDGAQLTPSSFGEVGDYGEWKPIEVSGLTYGTNGFYLDFKDSSALGNDVNGSNNFAVTNAVASDQMLDIPTNNFCTFNPLSYRSYDSPAAVTYAEGNLKATIAITAETFGSFHPSSGKWYVEILVTELVYGLTIYFAPPMDGVRGKYSSDGAVGYHSGDGNKYVGGSSVSYGATFTTGDIISIALDLDGNNVIFYKNGSAQGTISGGLTAGLSYGLFLTDERGGTVTLNCGQDSSFAAQKTAQGNQDGNDIGDFYYSVPANHLAMCTSNLPATIIPSEHFDTVLYTGNGGSKTISGFEFQPDLVWNGCRTAAQNMHLHTSITGSDRRISVNSTDSEQTDGAINSFTSDGYTFDRAGVYNTSGESYVNWAWEMGSTAGSYPYGSTSHTQGNRDTTISVNVAAGQCIMYWTGAGSAPYTLGHGLSKAPEMFMYRNINDNGSWNMSHIGTTNQFTKTLYPTYNNGETTSVTCSAISSTLITVPDGGATDSPNRLLAFAAHSVEGYSKIGHYIGNGALSGTFVYCGFRPHFVWIKSMGGEPWMMMDSARGTYNEFDNAFNSGEAAAAETTNSDHNIDFLSNGFKPRRNVGALNSNGDRYAFYAIAKTPLKYSNAR